MKFNAPEIVAIILASIMALALIGHILHWYLHPEHADAREHAAIWGKVYLTLVGGLLLYIGVSAGRKDK